MSFRTTSTTALTFLALLSGACTSHAGQATRDASIEDAGDAAGEARLLGALDVKAFELPEGLAVRDGVPFVGLAPSSVVLKVDPRTGDATEFATFPKPVPNMGFFTGLAFQPDGALLAGLASFTPDVQAGIYRVPAEGGVGTLFAKHPDMAFPNGLAQDAQANLYVTDSARGSIFRISRSSTEVSEWLRSELLQGSDATSCATQAGKAVGFDIGANGIVRQGDAFYVTNSDRGTIVRVPFEANGEPGEASVFAGPDCEMLGGADGITSDGENLIVANNYQDELVRVDARGRAALLLHGAPLDFPASPLVAGDTLYVTNFALRNASSGTGAPGLVAVDYEH